MRKIQVIQIVVLSLFASVLTAASAKKDISESILRNYDFTFGTDYWSVYRHNYQPENILNWKEPKVMTEKDGKRFLRISPYTGLQTVSMNIKPGQVYTVTAIARSAVKGKQTKVPCYMIDCVWHIKAKTAVLGDQWEKITFQQTFPFTRQSRAYFRIDTRDVPVDLASVCIVKGNVPEALPKPMDIRLGFVGSRVFSTEAKDNALTLKAVISEKAKLPVEVTLVSRDLWDKIVFQKKIKIEKAGESVIPVALNGKVKGVFTCEASAGKVKVPCNYAVLTPTAGKDISFHVMLGHFQLFEWPNRRLFNKFTTFKMNRFFVSAKVEQSDFAKSEAFRKVFRDSGYRNIINLLPEKDPKLTEMLKERSDLPEQAKKDFEDYLRKVIPNISIEGVWGVEVFNEPYLWYYWKDGKRYNAVPPEKLAALLKIANPIIRKLAPNLKIIGQMTDKEYYDRFTKAGGISYIDYLAIHPYCARPDVSENYQTIVGLRKMLRKATGRDIPVISTEQYFGVRDIPVYNHDSEYFRIYIMDTPWECARSLVETMAHQAAAGISTVFFAPAYMIDGFGPEAAVYHDFGIVNTATHIYANAGEGKILNCVPETIRVFYFPNAKPQPFAVVYSMAQKTNGRVLFQDPVRILNMMGNEEKEDENGISLQSPLYVFFPKGNAEKILEKAHWLNLGNPMKISILSDDTIDVQITNLSLRKEPLVLEMKKYPGKWKWKQDRFSATLAPKEKKTFRFQLENGKFQTMKNYNLGLRMLREDSFVMKPIRFSALFVPYQKDLDLKNAVWNEIRNVAVNHSKDPKLDHKGADDLSAKFTAVWNEKGVKVAIRVKDDKQVFGNQSLNSYKNDSLQVYFDMKRDATEMSDARKQNVSDDLDWLIYADGKDGFAYLIHNETGRFIGEANETTGIDPDVKVNFRKLSEQESEYEIFFPSAALPLIRFDEGTRFGFSLLINDNDGNGRKSGLTLAPAGTEPIFHAASYLDMILKKNESSPDKTPKSGTWSIWNLFRKDAAK